MQFYFLIAVNYVTAGYCGCLYKCIASNGKSVIPLLGSVYVPPSAMLRLACVANALASVARCLATSEIDPAFLAPFVACRLIPLDKNLGVRSIGIGDVPQRILVKTILYCISAEAAGSLQVCAGKVTRCEAAIHAMKDLFCDDRTEAALLVDASDAFNPVNHLAALHNISILCPALSMVLHNACGTPSCLLLLVRGKFPNVRVQLRVIPLRCLCVPLQLCP